tara:strand:+ start:83 stop:1027 length:945 start_codon:yes stop_codon:yes gene_type:complete
MPGLNPASVRTLVGLPMFNEEETVASVVVRCLEHVNDVLCVDDGSSDASSRLAARAGAIVHHHRANRGYGAAIRTIFRIAREMDVDHLVILDSDGQHEPEDLPAVLAELDMDGVDVVIGSRFMQESKRDSMPLYRRLGISMINTASNLTSDLGVKDTQSGFRAFNRRALNLLAFENEGMESTLEVLDQCVEKGLKVNEVPITVRYDVPKSSTYSAFGHGLTVLTYALVSLSHKKPLLVFGLPGMGLLISGTTIGLGMLNTVEEITGGGISLSVGPGLTGAWLAMLGIAMSFTGLVLHGARSLMRRIVLQRVRSF